MPKQRGGRGGKERERGVGHAVQLRNERKGKPGPVDPTQLPEDALDRRERYRAEIAEREAAAAKFVPLNQRGATRDEKGRLVALDWRDRQPLWLRRK